MDQLAFVSLLLRATGCAWLIYGLTRTPSKRLSGVLVLVATFTLLQVVAMTTGASPVSIASVPSAWREWESLIFSAMLLAWSGWTERAAAELAAFSERREAERLRFKQDTDAKQAELRARAMQQEVLFNLGRRTLGATDLRQIFDEAVHTAARALGVSHCALFEYSPATRSLTLRAASGALGSFLSPPARVHASRENHLGRALIETRVVLVANFDDPRDAGRPAILPYGAAQSAVAVCVPGLDVPFGVLTAHTGDPARFGEDEGHFLACVSNLLAAAVERERTTSELDKARHHKLQAEKLDALGKVVGGIAHDCNNVLHAILNYTQFAVRDIARGETDSAAHNLERVRSSANRVSQLMKQLLTFRPGSFGQRRSVSVARIVDDVVQDMYSDLHPDIRIRTRVSDPDARVEADGIELHRVLLNLCTNAVQAMQRSGGQLDIAVETVELGPDAVASGLALPPGQYVRIAVADTGHGILHGIRDRIFEPFFRASDDGDEARTGYGLGLWVVREVVKNHAGAIDFESELGVGSTFQVYLPRQTSVPDSASVAAASIPGRQPPRGSETVLFVDDEREMFAFTVKELELLGYDVVALMDPNEAIELFYRTPDRFHVVILDQRMPGLNGDELAIRMLKRRPDIPIIIYTGYAEALNEDRAYAIGVKRYLIKPIPMDALSEAIRAVLDESRAGADSQGAVLH